MSWAERQQKSRNVRAQMLLFQSLSKEEQKRRMQNQAPDFYDLWKSLHNRQDTTNKLPTDKTFEI
jgi:hypothetical protein